MRVDDPDSVQVTLNITLSLAAWKEIRADLEHPHYGADKRLADPIRELVSAVESTSFVGWKDDQ